MFERIAFIKTAWCDDFYAGADMQGRHNYVASGFDGYEALNYSPGQDGRYYVYIPRLGRYAPYPGPQDDWYLVHVAAREAEGPLTVCGWYEGASFIRDYLPRPEYETQKDFPRPNKTEKFRYCIVAEKGFQVPVAKRVLTVQNSARRLGRTPILYVRGKGDDDWRAPYANQADAMLKTLKEQYGE